MILGSVEKGSVWKLQELTVRPIAESLHNDINLTDAGSSLFSCAALRVPIKHDRRPRVEVVPLLSRVAQNNVASTHDRSRLFLHGSLLASVPRAS
jgi:hypothetical protein